MYGLPEYPFGTVILCAMCFKSIQSCRPRGTIELCRPCREKYERENLNKPEPKK